MKKAIIFDLDGTLLETLSDLAISVNFALNECGFPLRSREEIESFIGNGVKVLVKRSIPEEADETEFEKCLDLFRTHYLEHMNDNTVPFDGALDCLRSLRESGIKTAVVSNKLSEAVSALCALHFEKLVDLPIGVSDESERKPDPKNVLRAIDSFGVEKSEVLYVGDSEVDILTAKNAGVEFIGVNWGYRTPEQLLESGAEKIAGSFEEIVQLSAGKS